MAQSLNLKEQIKVFAYAASFPVVNFKMAWYFKRPYPSFYFTLFTSYKNRITANTNKTSVHFDVIFGER